MGYSRYIFLFFLVSFLHAEEVILFDSVPVNSCQQVDKSLINRGIGKKIPNLPIPQLELIFDKMVSSANFSSVSEEVDFYRHFIFTNSVHIIDKEHNSYAYNTRKLLNRILSHFFYGTSLPHAGCGPRASALSKILHKRGIRYRSVHTFSSKYANLRGHTFLEIFNPMLQRWEHQDPDFDFYFTLKGDPNYRLSTQDVVRLNIDQVSVNQWTGISTVWPMDPVYKGAHLQRFYEAVLFYQGDQPLFFINKDKFDLNKRFTDYGGKKFKEIIAIRYKNPKFIVY